MLILLTYASNMIINNEVFFNDVIYFIALPVVALLTTRTILKNYINGIEEIEAVIVSLIYIYALSVYNSEIDGMIFIVSILALIIYSYNKRLGYIFLVSIIAIIVNVFALTREFWLSIPWWLYMLTIGIILISFAIYNEKNKDRNADMIKKIRDKMLLK